MDSLPSVAQKRFDRFRKQLQRLQTDTCAENVHRFRIACRELLATGPLLKSLSPTQRWMPFVEEALDALDRLRDLQQMQERLLQEQRLPATLVQGAFEKSLRKAQLRWLEFMPQLKAPGFVLALGATEKALLTASAAQELPIRWQSRWEKTLRRVHKALLAIDADDAASLHRLRIRYKELRYLMELQMECNKVSALKKSELKEWQDMLGEVEDYRVMAKLAKKLGFANDLQQHYQEQGLQQARHCVQQRDHFSAFLIRINHCARGSHG